MFSPAPAEEEGSVQHVVVVSGHLLRGEQQLLQDRPGDRLRQGFDDPRDRASTRPEALRSPPAQCCGADRSESPAAPKGPGLADTPGITQPGKQFVELIIGRSCGTHP